MSVNVRIPTILRPLTGGASEVAVDDAATLGEVLDRLDADHPGVRARVLDDDDVRFASGLETPTPAGASVSIIPAVAGG